MSENGMSLSLSLSVLYNMTVHTHIHTHMYQALWCTEGKFIFAKALHSSVAQGTLSVLLRFCSIGNGEPIIFFHRRERSRCFRKVILGETRSRRFRSPDWFMYQNS